MGWLRKARKSIGKTIKRAGGWIPEYSAFKGIKGALSAPKDEEEADTGLRSAAAKRLVNKTDQAGGGQIKYNTEETVE